MVAVTLAAGACCSPHAALAQDAQPLPTLPAPAEPAPPPPPETVTPAPSTTVPVDTAPVEPPPSEPGADVPPLFGAKGQVVLSGTSVLSASHYEYDNSQATGSSFEFSPGADYFVARGVSIGIDADASYVYAQGYDSSGELFQARTTRVAFAPRVGFNIPLGRMVSLYPRFTLGYESISTLETDAFGENGVTASQSGAFVKLFVPILFHPIPRFYIGVGPDLFHDFGAVTGGPTPGGQATTLGASFVVGAYWGGEPGPAPPAADPPRRRRAFGEAGEFVLTNEIQSGFHFTTYAGGDLRSSSIAVTPAVEFFPANHVSIGVGMRAAAASDTSVDLRTRAPSSTDSSSLSMHGLLGLDLPIVEGLSLYPRAYLGIESETNDTTTAGTEVRENASVVYTGIELPLLVHPGPHVFVGVGPEVEHELSRAVTYASNPNVPAFQNRSTTVDAFLIVGGWF
jgi:hypothetical protein